MRTINKMATTISITDKVWVELNKSRISSGETFNEVIERLLGLKKGEKEEVKW